VLKNNQLNGTLDIGTSISNQLDLLDLQLNLIEEFKPQIDVSKVKIMYATICYYFTLIGGFITLKRDFLCKVPIFSSCLCLQS